MPIECLAAHGPGQPLEQFSYNPGDLGVLDVLVDVDVCGVCHGDINLLDNNWGVSEYPMVPGHEIVGRVVDAGAQVTAVTIGQRVGVGLQVGACLDCTWCLRGMETRCSGFRLIGLGTHGGFADAIKVDSRFVHPIPDGLDSASAAPLLCAGAAVFAPIRRLADRSSRIGVIGVGGLGHLALQYARAMGGSVTAFSLSADKAQYAKAFGAERFVLADDPAKIAEEHSGSLDLIVSTVDATLDWSSYLMALRPAGTLCFVGIPNQVAVPGLPLVLGQKRIIGSLMANRGEMREMLTLSDRLNIHATCEVLPMARVNEAVDRVRKSDTRFRIVMAN